ncbi:MAG: transcription termination/antitermination protein NusA [Alphaproteobacteria bacterium]|nr:MAG: transcription termination/antitermination protein NusA [Alphaproteobacteria bacterium]
MDLVQVVDAAAREKGIDREEMFLAIEEAVQKIGRAKYGHEHDIRGLVDRKTGLIQMRRCLQVVEVVENDATQMTLKEALRRNPDAKVGDVFIEELPPFEFGRVPAQIAKQVIVQKIREAERARQYAEYKDRVSEIVNGIVKRVEFGNVTVDLGRAEAVLRRDETLPREHFKLNDRVRAYIYDVRSEQRGPQIFLSRTHPLFMAKLFSQEVPEIYDGIIEIKAVARDPGSRAKIAVISHDGGIDPVGACVGMRGSRVQAVVGELQGEKIDIIPWSSDPATFVVNALAPAEVAKVVLDEEKNRMDVVVPDEQLSLAIGRRGQNVRLASMLTGWDIDILTEAEESERRQEEFRIRTTLFMEALGVDDVIAHLLVTEGFTRVEQIDQTVTEELAEIEGFDTDIAAELQSRAREWLSQREQKLRDRCAEMGMEAALLDIPHISLEMAAKLGEKNIRKLDDLADLAGDELIEALGDLAPDSDTANAIIMKAREHWFPGEAADAASGPTA